MSEPHATGESEGRAAPMAKRPSPESPPRAPDAALLGLIDRLGALLERSELIELEIQAGETAIVLRKAEALSPTDGVVDPGTPGAAMASIAGAEGGVDTAEVTARRAVLAPLTGIFYSSPTPDSAPYVAVGSEIVPGQVVGLIEAMKLFNEIKSELAGRVVRVVAEGGKLVKAKQPLIEVEPF